MTPSQALHEEIATAAATAAAYLCPKLTYIQQKLSENRNYLGTLNELPFVYLNQPLSGRYVSANSNREKGTYKLKGESLCREYARPNVCYFQANAMVSVSKRGSWGY